MRSPGDERIDATRGELKGSSNEIADLAGLVVAGSAGPRRRSLSGKMGLIVPAGTRPDRPGAAIGAPRRRPMVRVRLGG